MEEIQGLDPRWQEEAYEAAEKSIDNTGKACVVAPPGCGKTAIGVELLHNNPNKRAIWITENSISIEQTREHIQRRYGKPVEEVFPGLTFFTYGQYSKLKEKQLDELDTELVVFDEIHRAGAQVWGVNPQKIAQKENIKILGLTATPIRTDKQNMAEKICGGVSYELELAEAIARGIIPAPLVIHAKIIIELEERQKQVNKISDKKVREEYTARIQEIKREIFEGEGIEELLKTYLQQDGKYIVFCKNEKHLKEVKRDFTPLFQKVDPEVSFVTITSQRKKKENAISLQKLRDGVKDHLLIAFVIDMFNGSFHDKNLSGIIRLRDTKSYIRLLQQWGRVLCWNMTHVPLVLDFTKSITMIKQFLLDVEERAERYWKRT